MVERIKAALLLIAHCRTFHRSHIAAESIYVAHSLISETKWLVPVFVVILIALFIDFLVDDLA